MNAMVQHAKGIVDINTTSSQQEKKKDVNIVVDNKHT
jgi:hypothetical protein